MKIISFLTSVPLNRREQCFIEDSIETIVILSKSKVEIDLFLYEFGGYIYSKLNVIVIIELCS